VEERPETKFCKSADDISLAYQVFGDGPLNLLWTPNDAFPIGLMLDELGFLHVASRLSVFPNAG
jgi:hypothetical protein